MNIISDSTLDVKVLQETKSRYKLYSALPPLKELFKQNAEMAAHTSNETWARDIHEFWKNLIFRPARSAKFILD